MTQSEAMDTLLTLQFLNSADGLEIWEAEAAELDRIASSIETELLNGEFTGDENELSDPQLELFNAGEEENVNEEEEEDVTDVVNISDEELPKTELSKTDIYFQEFAGLISIPASGQKERILGEIWKQIETAGSKQGDLNFALAAFKVVTAGPIKFSDPQIGQTVNVISRQLGLGNYRDVVVSINGKPYRVTTKVKGKIKLQDLQNLSEYPAFEILDFLNSIDKIYEAGETIPNLNVDTVVKVEEFDYIKEAYNDILNNFTSYMGEANSLSEEDLLSNLKKETTKCK